MHRVRSDALPDFPSSRFLPGWGRAAGSVSSAPRTRPSGRSRPIRKSIGLADPKLKAAYCRPGRYGVARVAGNFGKFIADETEKRGKVAGRQHKVE